MFNAVMVVFGVLAVIGVMIVIGVIRFFIRFLPF